MHVERLERIRTYIWEAPVRLTHWVNFFLIIALSVTGIYIGKPFLHPVSVDAYTMGTMKFIHFIAAYAFLMSVIIRVYWAFAGNKYANWRVFLPLTSRQRHDLGDATRYYMFIGQKPPYAAGHTQCAGIAYFFLFSLSLPDILRVRALVLCQVCPFFPHGAWRMDA